MPVGPCSSSPCHGSHARTKNSSSHRCSAQIRDIDLDTLEKVTSIIAFGDIEAEDTRHLTELNFIKVSGESSTSLLLSLKLSLALQFH